jgi:hypothetical protein
MGAPVNIISTDSIATVYKFDSSPARSTAARASPSNVPHFFMGTGGPPKYKLLAWVAVTLRSRSHERSHCSHLFLKIDR